MCRNSAVGHDRLLDSHQPRGVPSSADRGAKLRSQLSVSEQEKHPEPTKNWYGPDMKLLTHYPGLRATTIGLGTCVQFVHESDDEGRISR